MISTNILNSYNADIIINNAYVITVNADMEEYQNGSVIIKDDRIIAIGNSIDLEDQYNAPEVIDGKNKLVMPGLINTHTHSAMTMLRGYADDIPLREWLYDYIFPIEGKFVTGENVNTGSRLAIAEMLRSGITTFNDMYFYIDETAKVVEETGIRAILSEGILDFPVPNNPTPEAGIKNTLHLIKKWNGHPRVNIAIATHATYSCSTGMLIKAKKISDEHNISLNIHLAETHEEFETTKEKYGFTPVGYLNDIGLLGDNLVAAHCIYLTNDDIRMLADNGVGVAHNPQCNMKIVSGVAPIPNLIKAGVKVGIGTDGAASNNDLDMFDEMRTAAFIHKLYSNDPTVMSAKTIVKAATIGGARVLGIDDQVGSLEKGKKADIIILDMQKPHAHPLYNIYSLITYSLKSPDVETVIVDGKIIMKNRDLLYIQEDEMYKKIDSLALSIKNHARELAMQNENKKKK